MGIFIAFVAPTPQNILISLFIFGFSASPFFIWGVYRIFAPRDARTLKEVREERKQEEELMKSPAGTASPSLVYDQLLRKYLRVYDPKVAYDALEHRIELYRLAGMSRGEAVRKLAEEEA